MRLLVRSAGTLVIVVGLLSLASLFVERVSEAWNPRDRYGNPISLIREHEKRIQLDQQLAKSIDRLDAKGKIVSGVLDDKLTLLEAAAGFAQTGGTSLNDLDFPDLSPRASKEEKLCRYVIEWVVMTAADERSAEEAALIRKKLEAELQEHLDRDGAVELPNAVSWGKRE